MMKCPFYVWSSNPYFNITQFQWLSRMDIVIYSMLFNDYKTYIAILFNGRFFVSDVFIPWQLIFNGTIKYWYFFNINVFIYHFHTLLNAMKSQSKLPSSRFHPLHPRSPVQASCFRLRAPSGAAEQKIHGWWAAIKHGNGKSLVNTWNENKAAE